MSGTRPVGSRTQAAPPRPLERRPWLAPVAVGVGLVLATGYVGSVDPGVPGHYPPCPLKAATGLDCPFCGSLRAVHAGVNGDLAAAADHNVLLVVAAPAAVLVWLVWLVRMVRSPGAGPTAAPPAAGRRAPLVVPLWLVPTFLATLVGFALVRNLPWTPWLGSGVG